MQPITSLTKVPSMSYNNLSTPELNENDLRFSTITIDNFAQIKTRRMDYILNLLD